MSEIENVMLDFMDKIDKKSKEKEFGLCEIHSFNDPLLAKLEADLFILINW